MLKNISNNTATHWGKAYNQFCGFSCSFLDINFSLFEFKLNGRNSAAELQMFSFFAFRFYYEVGAKYIISSKINFWLPFLNENSQRHIRVIFLQRSRGWKDFLYVCIMCVCMFVCMYVFKYRRGRKLYPITNKFGTPVSLMNIHVRWTTLVP